MGSIEQALLNYDDLPASERDAVDAYLAEHPEAELIRAEGRAVRALLDDAARAGAEVPDAESMARYLASQYAAGNHPLPPDLAALGNRIEDAFDEHPELERRYAMMQDRLKTLTQGAESPAAQFKRLTSLPLDPDGSSGIGFTPYTPTAVPKREPARSWRTSVTDRPAVPLRRRVSLPRLALAASLALALLYGGLFFASGSSLSSYERLAGLDEVADEFQGLRLRGADGDMDPVADRYAEALDALHDARSTTLGLFPSYAPDGLREATALLEQAASLGAPDGPIALEARFVIGKIRLYQGDEAAARQAFQTVVDERGPSAPDAQRLLDALAASVL
ncbi:MAG: hypothetical protein AAGI91_07385 [Bacteroidota bacterium]